MEYAIEITEKEYEEIKSQVAEGKEVPMSWEEYGHIQANDEVVFLVDNVGYKHVVLQAHKMPGCPMLYIMHWVLSEDVTTQPLPPYPLKSVKPWPLGRGDKDLIFQ